MGVGRQRRKGTRARFAGHDGYGNGNARGAALGPGARQLEVREVALSIRRTLLPIALFAVAALLVPLSPGEAQVSACAAPDKQKACSVLCCGRSPCAPSCQTDCVQPCVASCSTPQTQQAFSTQLSRLQARCGFRDTPRRVK
jgi:hypothetical protein